VRAAEVMEWGGGEERESRSGRIVTHDGQRHSYSQLKHARDEICFRLFVAHTAVFLDLN
jgi:hypothetical protein